MLAPDPSPEPLLTVREAAERLRLHPVTVRRMIADGRLPAVRLAGVDAVRIPAGAVEALRTPYQQS